MKPPLFPAFIKNLPEADLPVEGIRGWLLNGENGQVLFIVAEEETLLPEHSHGDQWGIVIDGEMKLTIGGKTEQFSQGDSYFIPAGTLHGGILYKGFRALDYFADKNRYSVK
jgi:quercetin dioxygenase-like cupin family protein